MKLQERQNHNDKADQWLPRDGVGEGKAGAKGHKGTFLDGGTIILQPSCGGGYSIMTKTH